MPTDLEADPSRDLDLHVAIGSKAFFSEEKKQKTFPLINQSTRALLHKRTFA